MKKKVKIILNLVEWYIIPTVDKDWVTAALEDYDQTKITWI